MPVALMFIGGLKVLQVTLLIVSLPILVVCTIAAVSLVKSLRADAAD
jgi:choline-glycine betaine transporter